MDPINIPAPWIRHGYGGSLKRGWSSTPTDPKMRQKLIRVDAIKNFGDPGSPILRKPHLRESSNIFNN